MDRSCVFRLAAAVIGAASLTGCMEPPKNDGMMFQRWARAVADIPVTDEEALARAGATAPAAPDEALPARAQPAGITLNAEAAGLRMPIRIAVVDPLEMPNSRDLKLRAAMAVAPQAAARLQPASMTAAPTPPPLAAAGAHAARIAAFRTRADAEARWNALKARHGDLLAGATPRFEAVDLGAKGTWVRLKAAGLPTAQAAVQVCRAAGVTDPWCAKG